MELIKQQRLNYLVEGTRFTKYSKGQRMKGRILFHFHLWLNEQSSVGSLFCVVMSIKKITKIHGQHLWDRSELVSKGIGIGCGTPKNAAISSELHFSRNSENSANYPRSPRPPIPPRPTRPPRPLRDARLLISHIYHRFRRSRMSRIPNSPIHPRKFLVNRKSRRSRMSRILRYSIYPRKLLGDIRGGSENREFLEKCSSLDMYAKMGDLYYHSFIRKDNP